MNKKMCVNNNRYKLGVMHIFHQNLVKDVHHDTGVI